MILYDICKRIFDILPGCLLYRTTGFYCPGCGGSRAVLAFLSGKVLLSFFYHPLVPLTAIYFFYKILHFGVFELAEYALKKKSSLATVKNIDKKTDIPVIGYLKFALVILIAQWIVKNVVHIYLMQIY
ncbi:MAG: DUF2752 domain-containing protein [Lachnospiraceae bacterium]|nr:DUF2752 domain-containing protein [Lachnospiraceae bacterium]